MPFTFGNAIGVAGLALQGLSTLNQIKAEKQQTEADREEGAYLAAVYRRNRDTQEQLAVDALALGRRDAGTTRARGRVDERLHRRDIEGLIGVQRAQFAGSGVEVDTGSALDLTSDTAAIGELEARTIRANTEMEARALEEDAERLAFEFRTRGQNFETEAELALRRATPRTSPFATALTGISSLAQNFATLRANRVI